MKRQNNSEGTLRPDALNVKQKKKACRTGGPITVTLSVKTSNLVRWYCRLTHHDAEHTVDGALQSELSRARADYRNRLGGDSFNVLLGAVLDAQVFDFDDRPALVGTGHGHCVELDKEASLLLSRMADCVQRSTHGLHAASSVAVTRSLRRLGEQNPGDENEFREFVETAQLKATGRIEKIAAGDLT